MNGCSLGAFHGETGMLPAGWRQNSMSEKSPASCGATFSLRYVGDSELHFDGELHFARIANLVAEVIGGDRRGVIRLVEDIFQVYL